MKSCGPTSRTISYCLDFLTLRVLVVCDRRHKRIHDYEAVFCRKLLSLEFATYDRLLSQPRARSLGRHQGSPLVEDLPTGLPEALVSLNPTGGFQLFKRRESAWRNVAALFASSLNGDTRFRIVAKWSGMRFALHGDSQKSTKPPIV